MPLTLFPGTDQYTAITVSGLYDNNTESPLFAPTGGTVPTSGIAIGGSAPAPGATTAFQLLSLDQANNALTFPGIQFVAGVAWTSATGAGTFQYNNGTTTEGPKTGAPAYVVQLDQTTTITGGAVTFQGTYDNINWVTIPTSQILNPNTFASLTNPYTFVPSTNVPFLILSQGYAQIRLDLSTAITGTGSVTPYWSALSYEPAIASSNSSTVSGTLSNNTAAPVADNVGVLGGLAATSYTTNTYTNGFQVLPVTDLHGASNTDMQAIAGVQLGATGVTAFGTAPAAVNVQGVNSSIFAGTTALTATGSSLNVNVTGSAALTVKGEYTNNTTATSTITDQFAVLPAIASTAYATNTWTNGNQVVLATDLHGAINNDMQAVAGVAIGPTSVTNFGTAPAAAPVQAVNSSIFSGTTALTNTGGALNVNITNAAGPFTVAGNLTNNNAAPIADNIGSLVAVTNSGAFPVVTTPAYTAGFQELLRVSQGGSLVTIPADEEYAQSISYYADDSGSTTLITLANATIVPLISIQSSSAAFSFLIREVTGYGDGSQAKFLLYKNPTLTGAAFTAVGIPTGSHIQHDHTATAVTAGTVVWSSMAASAPAHTDTLLQYLAAGAPGDTYTLAAIKFGTGTSKAFGSIRWSEEAAAI